MVSLHKNVRLSRCLRDYRKKTIKNDEKRLSQDDLRIIVLVILIIEINT